MNIDDEKKRRELRNKQLADMVRSGKNIDTSFSSFSSWFPPRPLVEKDPEAMKKLYSLGDKKRD
jgi:hypothetical protein